MSSDLVWQITRNQSSFLVKRSGVSFSREPGNLYNKHSLKYSTLGTKSVSIQPAASGKGAQVVLKKAKTASPFVVSKATKTTVINKNARAASTAVSNVVKHYRPDLKKAAAARIARIIQGQLPVKAQKAGKFRGRAKKI